VKVVQFRGIMGLGEKGGDTRRYYRVLTDARASLRAKPGTRKEGNKTVKRPWGGWLFGSAETKKACSFRNQQKDHTHGFSWFLSRPPLLCGFPPFGKQLFCFFFSLTSPAISPTENRFWEREGQEGRRNRVDYPR